MKKLYSCLLFLLLFGISTSFTNASSQTLWHNSLLAMATSYEDFQITYEEDEPINTPEFVTEGAFRADFNIEKDEVTEGLPFNFSWDIAGGKPPYILEVNMVGRHRSDDFYNMINTYSSTMPSGSERVDYEYQGPYCEINFKAMDSLGNVINKTKEFTTVEGIDLNAVIGYDSIQLKWDTTPLSNNEIIYQYINGEFVKINRQADLDTFSMISTIDIQGLTPNTTYQFYVQNYDDGGVAELNPALVKAFTTLSSANDAPIEVQQTSAPIQQTPVPTQQINNVSTPNINGMNVYAEVDKTRVKVGDTVHLKWSIDGDESNYYMDINWGPIYTIDTDTTINGMQGETFFTVLPGMLDKFNFDITLWDGTKSHSISNEELGIEIINEEPWQWEDDIKIELNLDGLVEAGVVIATVYRAYDVAAGDYMNFDYQWGIYDKSGTAKYTKAVNVEKRYKEVIKFYPQSGDYGILKVIAYEYSSDPDGPPSTVYYSDKFAISDEAIAQQIDAQVETTTPPAQTIENTIQTTNAPTELVEDFVETEEEATVLVEDSNQAYELVEDAP